MLDEIRPAFPPGGAILHFAPEDVIVPLVRRELEPGTYDTTDLLRSDVDLPGQDVQQMTLSNDSYDLVIINHVLEHVHDDASAIAELARVTRPGGLTLLTVPGDWRRHASLEFTIPDSNGHYRDYGLDVQGRLGCEFRGVEVWRPSASMQTRVARRMGITWDEPVFLCRA